MGVDAKVSARACLIVTWLTVALISGAAAADEQPVKTAECGVLRIAVFARKYFSETEYVSQIYWRSNDAERSILPTGFLSISIPGVGCLDKFVLVAAASAMSGHDHAAIVFPNGQYITVNADHFEFRNGVAVIPARPTLRYIRRDQIPAGFQDLFDYE